MNMRNLLRWSSRAASSSRVGYKTHKLLCRWAQSRMERALYRSEHEIACLEEAYVTRRKELLRERDDKRSVLMAINKEIEFLWSCENGS